MRTGLAAVLVSLFFILTVSPLFAAGSLNNRTIIKLINQSRKRQGLRPLKENMKLERSSRIKAADMVEQGYFSHTSPAGEPFQSNFQRVGYIYGRVGEVLSMGCTSERCVIDLWLNSAPHRQAMLDPAYNDVGCSNVPGRRGFYVVCHFGHR